MRRLLLALGTRGTPRAMGLDLMVGLEGEEDEEDDVYAGMFEGVNAVLAAHGLPRHEEPRDVPEEWRYNDRVGSYGTLHHLRRVAAHLEAGRPLPPPVPAEGSAADDPILSKRNAVSMPRSRFAHVLEHGDAEGLYLPIELDEVLIDDDLPGGYLGSSYALRRECEALANALDVPLDLDTDSDALHDGGDGSAPWHAHHIAARVCLVLHRAAEASIVSGAAILFC